jgi:hypothetical protein
MAKSGRKSKRFLAERGKTLCHCHGGAFASVLFSDRLLPLNIILLNLLVQRRTINSLGMSLAGGSVPVEDLYVLIDHNRVSIRISHHKAGRAGRAFAGF